MTPLDHDIWQASVHLRSAFRELVASDRRREASQLLTCTAQITDLKMPALAQRVDRRAGIEAAIKYLSNRR